jgi:hypothetical protein
LLTELLGSGLGGSHFRGSRGAKSFTRRDFCSLAKAAGLSARKPSAFSNQPGLRLAPD